MRTQAAAADRTLALRARGDVQVVSMQLSDQAAHVLKDPLTLELFHLTPEEYFLFEKLKQAISLKELQRAFQRRFAPRTITAGQLQQGVNQLHSQGLLVSDSAGQGSELHKRGVLRRRRERWLSCLQLLSVRLGRIDATRMIDGLHRRLRWVFSSPMLAVAVFICVYALSLLVSHAGEFVGQLSSLGELAQPRYWLMWLATIAGVKVIHELAHAITCQQVGGRCHEIGVLLLAGLPCLYCDVTDVWRVPSKWRRIAVSAAGMSAELMIAAIGLIVWAHAQPGLLQTWCLSLVIVCSVGTVLVNANPLLRYDGYYILSDLVEVPNLAERARGLFGGALRRWLLGDPHTDDALLSAAQRRGLWIYAIASRVYLTLVLVGIFAFLINWAQSYRMENVVYTLAIITLFGMALQPLIGIWRTLRNPAMRYRMRKPRVIGLLTAVFAVVAVVGWWPLTYSVRGTVVLVPADSQPVYAPVAGELEFALPPGTKVQRGEVIAQLADADLDLAVARQQGEYEVRHVRYQQLGTMRAWDERAADQLPTAHAAVLDAAAQLQQCQSQSDELTIRAPRDGVVIAPPDMLSEAADDSTLPTWAGSPLNERNLGSWIEAGTTVCVVGDPMQFVALVAIDQADIAEVAPGQTVSIVLEAMPTRVLEGSVRQVARRSTERTTGEMSRSGEKYHLVEVQLDTSDAQLLVGLRGTAKIEARRRTLSQMVIRQLDQMLHLPW